MHLPNFPWWFPTKPYHSVRSLGMRIQIVRTIHVHEDIRLKLLIEWLTELRIECTSARSTNDSWRTNIHPLLHLLDVEWRSGLLNVLPIFSWLSSFGWLTISGTLGWRRMALFPINHAWVVSPPARPLLPLSMESPWLHADHRSVIGLEMDFLSVYAKKPIFAPEAQLFSSGCLRSA